MMKHERASCNTLFDDYRARMCIESSRLEREEERGAPTYTEVHVCDSHRTPRVATGAYIYTLHKNYDDKSSNMREWSLWFL